MEQNLIAPLIILVEDGDHLAQGLVFNLHLEGFRTLHFAEGTAALLRTLLHS